MDKLRILMLEDNLADAEIAERELKRSGLGFISRRVDTKEAFEREIKDFRPDLILADYSLPQLNAMEALLILECQGLAHIPFIIVTGTIKEEIAMKCVESGAWDYVIKDHILRLSTAVRAALARREAEKKRDTALKRLERLNQAMLDFGSDPDENINRLVSAAGETMGAACALYNRLDAGMLCSVGGWKTPPDYKFTDSPEGHICYDVIRKTGDDVLVIRDLPSTHYGKTDPNVKKYGLKTYIGKPVKIGAAHVGSLCVVYQEDVIPGEEDKKLIGIIAAAISVEEDRKRTALKLKAEADKLEAVINNAPMIAIQGFDGEGTIRYWNLSSEALYGFEKKAVLGEKLQEVILTEKEADDFIRVVREVWATGRATPIREFTMQTRLGEQKALYSMMFPVYENGRISLIFRMDVDVTELKKAEAARKESEGRYQALFESMSEMVALHEIVYDDKGRPRDYRILDCNPAFTNILGIPREKAIGALASSGVFGISEAPYLETYARVSETGKAERLDVFFGPKSKYFDIFVFSPERGKFATVALDITARREAEISIRESEEKFKLIFEYAPDAYYLVDGKSAFVDGNRNAEKLIGRSRREMVGKSMIQSGLLLPEQVPKALALFSKNMMGLPTGPDDFTLVRRDGTRIETEITTYPVKIKGVSYVLGIARDITERKKGQEALVRTLGELKQYKEITVGRENKMVELKKEVNKLSKELGRSEPYDVSFVE